MRRTLSAAIVLAVVGSPLAYGATSEEFDAPGSTAEQPRYAPGQLSVKLAADLLADKAVPLAFAAANGAELLSATPETGWIWLEITDGMTVSQKAADLQEVPGVLSAIPVLLGEWLAFPADPPNDARWDDQWGMRRVGMPEAWRIAGGGSGSHIIAIVDSGIDRDHPDLGGPPRQEFRPA